MDLLSTFFLGCFLFGLVFASASLLLGLAHVGIGGAHGHDLGMGHAGADTHGIGHAAGGHNGAGHATSVDHGAHGGDGQNAQAKAGLNPLNLTCVMAFVAWFGGAGYLALNGLQLAVALSLVVAVLAGLVGWGLLYGFFVRVLLKPSSEMDPDAFRMEGTVARVTVPIHAGRSGEIQYSMGGSRRSDGARSLDGTEIARGTEVVVVRYEKGLAYVQPWATFVESDQEQ